MSEGLGEGWSLLGGQEWHGPSGSALYQTTANLWDSGVLHVTLQSCEASKPFQYTYLDHWNSLWRVLQLKKKGILNNASLKYPFSSQTVYLLCARRCTRSGQHSSKQNSHGLCPETALFDGGSVSSPREAWGVRCEHDEGKVQVSGRIKQMWAEIECLGMMASNILAQATEWLKLAERREGDRV